MGTKSNYLKEEETLIEREIHIKKIKDFFERELAKSLNLVRVSAPLFVEKNTGINDDLNGTEGKVCFKGLMQEEEVEIVQSLAKWKRLNLKRYGFKEGTGLYADMNAIRKDEELDELHSMYVDQWDWEKIISKEHRNIDTLKETVNNIYKVFKETENYISSDVCEIEKILPEGIFFITSQELEDRYPNLTAKERENEICKQKGAVFIMAIGDYLESGEKHDGRAPDYDDWHLNGDILFWYPVLNKAIELSSMGIRVDKKALEEQLKKSNAEDRKELYFHKQILAESLPYTIGGGIGQSRICMYFLRKSHIGEVQASIWDKKNIEYCEKNNIRLL